jgi:hypothetical protein
MGVARGRGGGARVWHRARGDGGGAALLWEWEGFRLRLGLSLGRGRFGPRDFGPAAEFAREKAQRGGEGGGEAETVAGDGAGEDGAGEGLEGGVIHHRHALEDFQDDDADDCVQPAERAGLALDQFVVCARFGSTRLGHALIIGVLGKLSRTKSEL